MSKPKKLTEGHSFGPQAHRDAISDAKKDAEIEEKIKDTDLNVDRLENLARLVVDKWDMESLVQFAEEQVFQDYQYDIDRAVSDAEDYTLEELDRSKYE